MVDDVKKVCDTAETINALVGGTATRSSSSRAKEGSREGIASFFPSSGARSTRSSETGARKSYFEPEEESDADVKKTYSGKKKKVDSDDEYKYPFVDDYPPASRPNKRMLNTDSLLSSTIDTGSQEEEMDFEDRLTVKRMINTPRPVPSHSKSKIKSIKYSQEEADHEDDMEVYTSEVALSKPVMPKGAHEPGKIRSAFKSIEASVSAKKAPSTTATAAVNDHVIHIDDENSNEAISIADTEAEWAAAAVAARANHSQDQLFDGGSQEERMVKTGEWQAITHGEEQHFVDHDDRDDTVYQSQAEPPLEQEEANFYSAESNQDSDGSALEDEAIAFQPSRGGYKDVKKSDISGDTRKKKKSLARAFDRASRKDSPATSAASALSPVTQTPNRNHIREEKLPTPYSGVSTATAFVAEPKNKTNWPGARIDTHLRQQDQHQEQEQELAQEKSQAPTFPDNGTGTQSDSEASTSRTKTHAKYRTTQDGLPIHPAGAEAGVSRARTGPGHAAHRHHHPAEALAHGANMLGAQGALDARFEYTEPSPLRPADKSEESQEWMETKSPNGKRPLEGSKERIEDGRKPRKHVQSDEGNNHRAPILEPPVILSVDPVAPPSPTRTKQRESTEHAPNFVDLT